MGNLGQAPTLPQAPTTPDASDEAFQAARRARGLSIFSLSNGYAANFRSGSDLQAKNTDKGPVTYGTPGTLLTSGQIGDDQGTTAAPDLRDQYYLKQDGFARDQISLNRGAIDPNNPNATVTIPGTNIKD